jgi:hypothetical protein
MPVVSLLLLRLLLLLLTAVDVVLRDSPVLSRHPCTHPLLSCCISCLLLLLLLLLLLHTAAHVAWRAPCTHYSAISSLSSLVQYLSVAYACKRYACL